MMILCVCVYSGSDVNSMDSVDSGCTMSAVESQSNHGASSSSDLIIWEIEVPKVSWDNNYKTMTSQCDMISTPLTLYTTSFKCKMEPSSFLFTSVSAMFWSLVLKNNMKDFLSLTKD